MALRILDNRKHHGRTVRTVFTAADDSREAVDAALAALNGHVRREGMADAARRAGGAYRKKAAKRDRAPPRDAAGKGLCPGL